MKTFCDLLAIKTDIELEIELDPIIEAGVPHVIIRVNNCCLYHDPLPHRLTITSSVGIRDPVCVEFVMSHKIYKPDLETAVIIRKLSINGFDIVPDFTHLAVYDNDHCSNQPTNYLGYNGSWTLDTAKPFYEWKHEITNQGWFLRP